MFSMKKLHIYTHILPFIKREVGKQKRRQKKRVREQFQRNFDTKIFYYFQLSGPKPENLAQGNRCQGSS